MRSFKRFSMWRVAAIIAGLEVSCVEGMHLAFTSTGRIQGAFNSRLGAGHIK